jgi:DNA helicase-2/ATP-dependent DNA helicase PcrA
MTRAKKRLYLLRAVRRSLMGGVTANPPSRFLRDIPKHLTRHASLYGDEGMLMPCGAATVMEFQVGDRVQHSRFGQGVVVGCSQARDDCELEVAFSEFGTKKLLSSLARLQRLQDD